MKVTNTYVTLAAGTYYTYYICTSDKDDTNHYVTKPVGDGKEYQTCTGYRSSVVQVIYHEIQSNGVLAVVGSEPKNIRH